MTILLTPPRTRSGAREPQPPCPGCGSGLAGIDVGRDRLWMCDDCGTVMPRS